MSDPNWMRSPSNTRQRRWELRNLVRFIHYANGVPYNVGRTLEKREAWDLKIRKRRQRRAIKIALSYTITESTIADNLYSRAP